jgi:chromosome partitioning protein
MHVISVLNQKGGSAKTTTAIHLAAGLAQLSHRTLLIDVDPQSHVAEGLGYAPDDIGKQPDITHVIERKAQLSDAIRQHAENFDLALTTDQLAFTEFQMKEVFHREDRLKTAVATVSDWYEYIIIDCPPALSLLTVNALSAATHVIIPMVAEYFALAGVERLLRTLDDVQVDINPQLSILGILPTRVGRTTNAREIVQLAHERFADMVRVYELVIPETVRFREAAALGKTIYEHAPEHVGAKAYLELTKDVLHA